MPLLPQTTVFEEMLPQEQSKAMPEDEHEIDIDENLCGSLADAHMQSSFRDLNHAADEDLPDAQKQDILRDAVEEPPDVHQHVWNQFTHQGESIVDRVWFNAIIVTAIVLNALIMSIEVDRDIDLGVASKIFQYTFTSIWFLEMLLKMWFKGCLGYFHDSWNRLDFLLVNLSLVDTVLTALSFEGSDLRMFSVVRVMRVARAVRILRVLQAFSELWLLVSGLIRAFRVIVWVMVLLVLVLYVGALLTTNVVGSECREGEAYEHFWDCEDFFATVPRSMYTLFQVITLESWSMAVARPVLKQKPWMILFFAVFMYFTTFGLLNVFTGVIVEQTLNNAEANRAQALIEQARNEHVEIAALKEVFQEMDVDGTGHVSVGHFVEACKAQTVQDTFDNLGIKVSRESLARRVFEVIDSQRAGRIELDEFLERVFILKQEGRYLNTDSTLLLVEVRHLACRLDKIESKTTSHLDSMEARMASQLERIEHQLKVIAGGSGGGNLREESQDTVTYNI